MHVNDEVMIDFTKNLKVFDESITDSSKEVQRLLNNPGFNSAKTDELIYEMKRRLDVLSSKWKSISEQLDQNLNISIKDIQYLEESIGKTIS